MKNILALLIGAALLVGLFLWFRPAPAPMPLPIAAAPLATVLATPVAVASAPVAAVFEIVVAGGKLASGPAVISVTQGTPVTLRITTDHADELHLHGYDLTLKLPKGQAAELSFVADRSGRFEYELHHAHLDLGALEVQPR
ncbi:MAG: hypothetical protein V4650_15540 [Pseudomonadota bacterium]